MLLDRINVSIKESARRENYPMEDHIIAGLMWFIDRYPEALFKLKPQLASYIVNLESNIYADPAREYERVYSIASSRTTSSIDDLIEHLGGLQVHEVNRGYYWFKPKREHARVLSTQMRGDVAYTEAMYIYGSVDSDFEVIYDLDEAYDKPDYFTRSCRVMVPSSLPHPSIKPVKPAQDTAANVYYANATNTTNANAQFLA